MAIQDDNTVLSKGDLKEYHQKILPYLGGNLMLGTNVSDYYSTDEKIVGVWTDGRPLYQKTIDCGEIPTATTKNVAHGVSSLNNVIDIRGVIYSSTSWLPLPYAHVGHHETATANWNVELSVDITNIIIKTTANWSNMSVRVTLQYTKTTDAANSAVTTPGCYDINFPNTWPENKEIFFGNGLYGFRYVPSGIISCPNKEQTETYPLTNLPLTARFKSMGGCLGIDENNILEFPWNYVDASNSTSISAQCGGFYFSKDSNNKYRLTFYERNDTGGTQTLRNIDVWVTYTK